MTKALPESCLNCGKTISDEMVYCPNCGQRNRKSKLPLRTFLSDFFEDYFTVDAKFFKSIGKLIFTPGALTKEFNLGRRRNYIAPFRLYIFVSFLYFFVLGMDQKIEGNFEDNQLIQFENGKENIERAVSSMDSLLIDQSEDSLITAAQLDSLKTAMKKIESENTPDLEVNFGEDSVSSPFENFFEERARRANDNPELFIQTVFKASSVAMFVMLPFFGLLLFLFHFRKHKFYVEHLVHSVHFHSFLFVIFFFALIASMLADWDGFGWIFLVAFVYLVLSLRTAYNQSYVKAILKAFLLIPIYSIAMTVGTILVILGAVLLT